MIKRLLLFFTMLFFWHNNYAQNYNMTNGMIINTCSGNFYDSGGPEGEYENAQQQIMTFCPDSPESAIRVFFNSFDLQDGSDFLFIYDGPDANSPLIATLTGEEIPLVQSATGNNPSGCLTFRFASDGAETRAGWEAVIDCVTPCQSIVAYLDYSFPSRNEDGVIKACVGQEIALGAQATFSGNGGGSTYTWDFGNDGTATGQNTTVTYNLPGVYRVNVVVTDDLGCRNTNIINQIIQVSPDPNVTIDLPPEICFGVDTIVTVEAEYDRIIYDCSPPVVGTTYLPDGDDDVYSTFTIIDCFENDAKITNANQIARVCINLEHSFSGDLTIRLYAPDGSSAVLYDQGGGATTFGHSPLNNLPIPGVGETYCFTMNAATIVNDGERIQSNEPRQMWVPGDYLPITGFENFIDSPINGLWTLEVHDQLGNDNGYIFGWSIEFSDEVIPADYDFQPVMESISVPLTNGVVDVVGNQFTINPEVEGELCFDVTILNDFGCPFVKRICTIVDAQIVLNEPRELEGCVDDNGVFLFDFQPVFLDLSTNDLLVFSVHSSELEANEATNALANTQLQTVADGVITYWVRAYNVVTGCFKVTSFTAQALNCTLNLVHLPDLSICEGQVNSFDLAQYSSVVYNNNLNFTVVYYNSEDDAINQTNPIDTNLLANYVGTNNETIWVRVQNINNVDAFAITSFKLFIFPVPVFYDLTPIYGCEIPGSGLANFNLSSVQTEASGLSPNIEVSFYRTIAEAEIGDVANALPLNYTGFQGTIYVRAYNPNTGCFTIMPLVTNVVDAPGANEIDPLEVCDNNNDGFAVFNLIPTTTMIAGNPIPPGVQVTYHETLADANNNVNRIQNIGAYPNAVANSQTIYVRVGYANSTCSAIVPLQLIVNASPNIIDPTPLQACDSDNNGIADFDLTSKTTEILNGLNPLDYVVTFYISSENAEAGTNEITNPASYTNLTSSVVSVRVQNIHSGCYTITKLILVTNPTPVVAKPIATYSLCDDNFDGFQVFDIASKIPLIVGSQTGLQVTFHYSLADANSGSNPLASPYQNVVQNVQTLYVRVQRLSTGCFTTSTMDIRVTPTPVLNVPTTPFDICSNTDTSFGTINLTSYNAQFLNGGPAYDLKYFETEANAQNNVLPILNPDAYNNLQANNPSVWVRATNVQTGCFSVYKVNFRLYVSPKMPLTLPDVVTCDVHGDMQDGITPINLAQQTPLILAAQTVPGTYEVRYFTSLVLANVGTNWIANPEAYMNATNPQTFWVRVQNAAHPTTCFEVKSFNVVVNKPLQLGLPSPIAVCDNGLPNNQQATFDLTIRQGQITQGQIFGVTLKYYTNEAEAKAGINEIGNPTSYVNTSNPQTVWVSVENMHGCFSYTTLTLRVLPLPEPNLNPTALQECETALGSNEAVFNLRLAQPDLSNGNATLTYKYFISEQEAIDNVGEIGTPEDFLTGSMTIYVRVSNTPTILSESCFVIVPLQLIVNSLPTIGTLTPLLACELNTDGIYTFDLRDKNQQVLGNQNAADFDIRYYVTETAALLGEAPIPYIYTNAAADLQTIWVRIQHRVTGCYSIASLDLKVEEKVFAYPPSASLAFCDTDGVNDGFGPANLTVLNAGIISTQNLTADLDVRYYTSWANYNAGNTAVATQFPITSNPQLVIAEVYNTIAGELCTATVEFYVTMDKAPSFEPIADGYVCTDFRTGAVNGYLMDTELPAAGYSFTWMRNNNVLADNGPSLVATAAGTYTVTVTSNATGCSTSQTITVLAAPAVSIDEINISEGFSETNDVVVIASAAEGVVLEYAMDEGAYQDSNIFVDVAPGTHIIWVKVKGLNACATSKVINVLNYPKFFTPNNDGYNDTWNIFALKDQPQAKIYIFDRQGKLLKQLSPAGEGWDGTFNNNPLPSSDYWFRAEYIEPNTGLQKEATGHFTLKR